MKRANRQIVLSATSPYEMEIDRATGSRLWVAFLSSGSTHSLRAGTLPYIMRRCEREGVPYILKAVPGKGYNIKPLHEVEEIV
jgi:hypothetical protein